MNVLVTIDLNEYEFVLSPDQPTLGDDARPLDPVDAPTLTPLLHRCQAQPFLMEELRALIHQEWGGLQRRGLTDDQVVEQVAALVARGRIRLMVRPRPFGGGAAVIPPREEAPAEPEPAAAEKEKHSIKFHVVDDETGDPVPGVVLKVKLPTGEVREFTSDSGGMVVINDIPPGACDIEKMIDADALEVVNVE